MSNAPMWPRWLAVALLGLPLTVGVVGLLARFVPGPPEITALPWMLLVFPVWTAVMSLAFVFRNGFHAWLWLGGATLLSVGALFIIKSGGVGA